MPDRLSPASPPRGTVVVRHTVPSLLGAQAIHGDKQQGDRMRALRDFKKGDVKVLVATDVAARGLDIAAVMSVVNYDCARNIETHIHRVGRTGRMSAEGAMEGTAYTLITKGECNFANQLLQSMLLSGQEPSAQLLSLAKKSPHYGLRSAAVGGG